MDDSKRNTTYFAGTRKTDILKEMKSMYRSSSEDTREPTYSLNKETAPSNNLKIASKKRNNSHENPIQKNTRQAEKEKMSKQDSEYIKNLQAELKAEVENLISEKINTIEFIKYSQVKIDELNKKTIEKQIEKKKINNLKEINKKRLDQEVDELSNKKQILQDAIKKNKDEISLYTVNLF